MTHQHSHYATPKTVQAELVEASQKPSTSNSRWVIQQGAKQ